MPVRAPLLLTLLSLVRAHLLANHGTSSSPVSLARGGGGVRVLRGVEVSVCATGLELEVARLLREAVALQMQRREPDGMVLAQDQRRLFQQIRLLLRAR